MRYLDASQAWYVVHCKPNSEKTALLNLKNQGFFPFLPLQKVTFRKGAAFQTKLRPLFPGYMFVAQKPTSSNWHKINNTRGVVRLVTLTAEPTPVPPIIMNQIFARCDMNDVYQQNSDINSGDYVKITQGPLAGAIGEIIKIDPDKRVHLLFDFMGQKSSLTINSVNVISPS